MSSLVLDRHRPTLGELSARWPRRLRWGLAALVAVAALAILAGRLTGEESENVVVVRAPVAFNFAHPDALRRAPPETGQSARVVATREDGLFLQSFAAGPLELPPYRGEAGGILPVVADTEIAALARRHDQFELVQEGKTRVNDVPGYAIAWQARMGERRLFGRTVLLAEPTPGSRAGARLDMRATFAAGVSRAEDVGVRGIVKRPFRSFRFGTERP